MAKLIFRLTPGESLDFPLNAAVTRLGRHASNEIVINNTWISSFHAEFRRAENGSMTLHDLKSSNGTTVNGETISSCGLNDGDRIGFGQVEAVYLGGLTAPVPAALAVPRHPVDPAPFAAPVVPATPVKQPVAAPVQPVAAVPVIARPMTAPPATIAYDTVRKEGTLELEALTKKLDEAGKATAEAVKNRTEAEAALTKVQGELKAAEKARQDTVEGGEAARLAIEEEKTRLSALRETGQARLAAVTGETTALAAEQERLVKSVTAAREAAVSAQESVAKAREEQRKLEESLASGRTTLEELQRALAEGKAALESLAKDRAAAEAARETGAESLRESETGLEKARAEQQQAMMAIAAAREELEELKAGAVRLREEAEQWKRESGQWPVQAATAKAELTELREALSTCRTAIAAEERRQSELEQGIRELEAREMNLKERHKEWEEREAAAALTSATIAEQQALSGKLRQEVETNRAAVSASIAALSAAEARRQGTDGELEALRTRLEQLRQETQGAEALNSKVADLRQQQAEAERRLAFLDDRLSGMSEAPDPNWGTVHSLARSFIRKLDLIDDLIAHLTGQPEASGTLDQLKIFRAGLLDILKEYSIEAYSLEPGTVIDVAARKRIQIVETLSEGSHDGTRVVRTYRPGYVCRNGDLGISTLLRKADVAVSIPLS